MFYCALYTAQPIVDNLFFPPLSHHFPFPSTLHQTLPSTLPKPLKGPILLSVYFSACVILSVQTWPKRSPEHCFNTALVLPVEYFLHFLHEKCKKAEKSRKKQKKAEKSRKNRKNIKISKNMFWACPLILVEDFIPRKNRVS